MPIATCTLHGFEPGTVTPEGWVDAWAMASGCDADQLTIGLSDARVDGHSYRVIAHLALPTLWTGVKRGLLGTTLAAVLARKLEISVSEVLVMIVSLRSGEVIEGGKVVTWPHLDDHP